MSETPPGIPSRPHLSGWLGAVLSAPQAQPLAHFSRDLLGWPLDADTADWCTMQIPGAAANLAFQSEVRFAPPESPAGPGRPHMMLHLDIGHSTWRRRSSPRRSSAPTWLSSSRRRTCG